MIFGLRTDKNEVVLNYYIETNKRINTPDPIKNPFSNSKIAFILRDEKVFLICDFKTFWVNFSPFVLYSGLIAFLFSYYKTAIILSVIGGVTLFMRSRYFYALMLYIALRKKGYKGSIRLISDQKLLEVVTYG